VRIRTRAGAAVASLATSAALGALAGCSLVGGSATTAATVTAKSAKPSAPSSYSPLAGPSEPASALPRECSQILGTDQLRAVFGAGLPIGDDYGSYAALPSIGRTGRVVCVFGVGLDSFGRQSAGAVEVAVATYTSASDAVGRAADTVQGDVQAGATTSPVSVGGHPATVVVEQTAGSASSAPAATGSPSAGASTSTSTSAAVSPSNSTSNSTPESTSPPQSTSPSSSSSSSSPSPTDGSGDGDGNGETELVMADGNRTFVLQIPFAKLPAQQAITALTRLALEVYQNTLPSPAASGTPSPSTR
jgi:hypothetical protein